uniref:DNA 3'-5' helicase n=1 Tax=Peronospora matthiolae TaxID=2874970 RepID=A0AAV1V1F7_9STRA
MWPRRQARGDSSTAAQISNPAARIASDAAATTSAPSSVSSAPFLLHNDAGKAVDARVKCHHEVKNGEDDAAWLSRALDAKKMHKHADRIKKKSVKSLNHESVKKKTRQKVRKDQKGKALDFTISVQERQRVWRSGAEKTSLDKVADRARQQEREKQEVGFDCVFKEVFGEARGAIKKEDERFFDGSLGLIDTTAALPLPRPCSLSSISDEDSESVADVGTRASGKRKTLEVQKDGIEEEAWSFASNVNSTLSLDDFEAPPRCSEDSTNACSAAAKAAELERWKVDNAQSAVSDNFVRLNMRKRPKGSSGRAKKRPAYLRARSENPLDEATGDNSTGIAPLVDAKGSQHRKQEKVLLADDGVDFIEECLEALSRAEEARGLTTENTGERIVGAEQKMEACEPPRCHHALPCQSLEVKKKNKNCGRRFFACPLNFDEGRCDFFLWGDDHVPLALQTLFTASTSSDAGESAVAAASIECVPMNIEATVEEQREAMLTNLRLVFGHADFRPGQQWAISRVLRQQDTLLVLPTGAGKSLCYQFPALFLPGITLVISPLISLMNDQYESLPDPLKARAACLSGSPGSAGGLSKAKHAAFVRDLLADKLSLIFLSPEKALGAGMQSLLAMPRVRARLALVCVDEAHCISEWSHHFRPSYLRLAEVFRHARCVLCVTATASRRVVREVLHQLRSRRQLQVATSKSCAQESDMVLQMPWQRRNLALEVRSVRSNDERLQHLVHVLPELSKGATLGSKGSGGGVIVYVHQQRQTEELAALLREQLPSAWRSTGKVLAFHAGMSPEAKEKVRTGFARGRVRVVVATVAFGMGIDKKNVRAVVHFHMPSSVEGYVQQVGRAGRDGKHARALLYLLDEDAVYFRSLLFSTALHREQLRKLLAFVFQDQTTAATSAIYHVVTVNYSGQRDGGGFTLVSLDCDWLERHLDMKAATIETFLTLLALESQREDNKEDNSLGLRVRLNPSSMSRCTLQLLDTQARKLAPCSFAKLLLEAVRRNELPNARATHRKDGYLSSWTVDFHVHEAVQWYQRRAKVRSALEARPDTGLYGGTVAIAVNAATNERRMLQELRAAKQAGQIQHLSRSQPAFQVQLSWHADLSETTKAEIVDHFTTTLYAKHKHLESRQLSRLAHLYGALRAAALPTPSPAELRRRVHDDNLEEDLEDKARALEAKFARYFDDYNELDVGGTDEINEGDCLLQTKMRPLTPSLIESIERDTMSLIQLRVSDGNVMESSEAEEDMKSAEGSSWTSFMVAKIFHGLPTPQLSSRQWRDHICWRRYSDVAYERIVQIAQKVLMEDGKN